MKNNLKEIIIIIFLMAIIGSVYYITTNKKENNTSHDDKEHMPISKDIIYNGFKEIVSDETIENDNFSSSDEDTNTILINSGNVNMENITITKTGNTNNSDNSSFYGVNSGLLIKDNAILNIKNSYINTDGIGANGIFSNNGNAIIDECTINTVKDLSGGIMVANNGNITANNLAIKTMGNSSAAIRSDRGGGVIVVEGGLYETNGKGSPAIYSTANITVNNASLQANHSEGIVIEGKNSVSLNNVKLVDTNDTLNGKSTTYKNIFLYQSMSGDATNGVSNFKAINSNIITNKGDIFYVTNTDADIYLENNAFVNNDSNGYFLRIQKDSWGIDGLNGGIVNVSIDNQSITGNIYVDEISTLNINMNNMSYFEGIINGDNTGSKIELILDKKSKIKLMGDSYITSINDANRAYTNIDFNGYKLYVNNISIN